MSSKSPAWLVFALGFGLNDLGFFVIKPIGIDVIEVVVFMVTLLELEPCMSLKLRWEMGSSVASGDSYNFFSIA